LPQILAKVSRKTAEKKQTSPFGLSRGRNAQFPYFSTGIITGHDQDYKQF
jgi:hypothetical protein